MTQAYHNAETLMFDALIERDYGIFSGMEKTAAFQMMQQDGFDWLAIPESETSVAIDHRVRRVLAQIATSHPNKKTLISTHEDVVRSFYRVLNNLPDAASIALEISNSQPHYFSSPAS